MPVRTQSSRRRQIMRKIFARVVFELAPRPGQDRPCWVWGGPTSGNGRGGGYPRMSLDGQTVAVHRVMYTQFFGYVPGRKQIDHRCRNRRCVAPHHLEMLTHHRNMRRRDEASGCGKGG